MFIEDAKWTCPSCGFENVLMDNYRADSQDCGECGKRYWIDTRTQIEILNIEPVDEEVER